MKAVVLEGPGKLVYRDVPAPVPGAGEVLLRVEAASICGSDVLRVYAGHAKVYPLILGHEVAGTVAEVGPGVGEEWRGRRVTFAPLIPCMKCVECRNGRYSACRSYSFIGSRQAGGFAEYCVVPALCLVPLPEGMDFELGAILEPATVAIHALERGGLQAGQSVAILGAGSVGQYAVQWARLCGAGLILVSDRVDENLESALRQGAHHALHPEREDVAARVAALTEDGVDLVVEAVGLPETLLQAITVARPRGTVVCVGNQPKGAALPAELIEAMMRKELSLCGTWMSYSAPFPGHEWTEAAAAAQRGELEMREMISHRFPLAEVPQVFAQIESHALAHRKIIVTPSARTSSPTATTALRSPATPPMAEPAGRGGASAGVSKSVP